MKLAEVTMKRDKANLKRFPAKVRTKLMCRGLSI